MWFQLHEVVACVECIIIEVVHRRLYRAWEYIDSILMLEHSNNHQILCGIDWTIFLWWNWISTYIAWLFWGCFCDLLSSPSWNQFGQINYIEKDYRSGLSSKFKPTLRSILWWVWNVGIIFRLITFWFLRYMKQVTKYC